MSTIAITETERFHFVTQRDGVVAARAFLFENVVRTYRKNRHQLIEAYCAAKRLLVTFGELTPALQRGESYEAARRELTELLIGATRRPDDGSGLEHRRARSRTLGVDVDAHVSREGPLAVVTHVHVRRR